MKIARRVALLAILGLAAVVAGCGSVAGVGPGSGSFVSTKISNTSRTAVDKAVVGVFTGDGFQLVSQSANGFTFRKWGGASTVAAYGDWFSEGVAVTPEILITKPDAGVYRVHCDLYMLEKGFSGGLEEKWKPVLLGKAGYQGLLNRVKKQAQGRR